MSNSRHESFDADGMYENDDGLMVCKYCNSTEMVQGDYTYCSKCDQTNFITQENMNAESFDAEETPFVWCVVRSFDVDDGSGMEEVENTEVLGVFKYKKDADKAMKSVYNEMKSQGLEEDYSKEGFYTDNGYIKTTKSKLGQLWMPYGAYRFWNAENWGGDPEGPLAKALEKARKNAKKPKKPLKIERLESFEAPKSGYSRRSQTVPFSMKNYWLGDIYEPYGAGFPTVDEPHSALISKIVDGKVLMGKNKPRIPTLTFDEAPSVMTWEQLKMKEMNQKVNLNGSKYDFTKIKKALRYLPNKTTITIYSAKNYPLSATFEYGDEVWLYMLAPIPDDSSPKSFEAHGHKGLTKLYGISGKAKIQSTVERILADINEGLGFADDEYYYLTEQERDDAYDDLVENIWGAESFEAPRDDGFKGVNWDLGEEGKISIHKPERSYGRSREDIEEMIDMVMNRLYFFKRMYFNARNKKDRKAMYLAIRNFKALEGANQALRWSLGEKDVEHPLY